MEEKIGKMAGRRTAPPDVMKMGMALQALAGQLHKSFGHRWAPKGVYRFNSQEEADAWMGKMLAQSQIARTLAPGCPLSALVVKAGCQSPTMPST